MPEYTVLAVTGTENWSKDGKSFVGYFVTIRTPEGREIEAKTNRVPSSNAPAAGEVIEGTLTPGKGNFPPLLKRTGTGGGGGGGGRDPKDTAAMSRSAAQDRALAYMQVKATMGVLKDDFKPDALVPLIEWFQSDVKRYQDKDEPKTVGGLPVRNEPQRTGAPEPTTPSADYPEQHPDAGDVPWEAAS